MRSRAKDAASLLPGEFVQFTATFTPSQIIALLDIVTPNLVSAITRQVVKSGEMKKFTGGDLESVQKFKITLDSKVESAGELAAAVTEAMTIDFRSTKTREFFGRIGSNDNAVTAITICDLAHFVVEDEDRVLDGQFTVLGKVTTPVEDDVPVLGRNKVLERFRPEAVDSLVDSLNTAVSGQAKKAIAKADALRPDDAEAGGGGADEPAAADLFDFTLDSRVHGPSFKVVPIAIYV